MSLRDELLSAYIDGEIESPHKELIDRQITSNDDIRVRYHRLLEVKEALRDDHLPDFRGAQERVWQRLQDLPGGRQEHTPFWRQEWKLPAPLVAAAALAFAFLLGFSVWHAVTPSGSRGLSEVVQSGSPVDLTISLADTEVERLLSWLSSREMLGEITVELPESHRFEIIGDAQLLRATDFVRARE